MKPKARVGHIEQLLPFLKIANSVFISQLGQATIACLWQPQSNRFHFRFNIRLHLFI